MRKFAIGVACLFVANALQGCLPSAGGPDMAVETIRPVGLLGANHAVTMIGNDASTVVSPVNLATETNANPHYANYCSALSPEGVEAAAAATATSGALDVALPSGPEIGGKGEHKQSASRLVLPRPWNKTQGIVLFESYRFALCEAWRNKMLDNPEDRQMTLAALNAAFGAALQSTNAEVETDGWKARNQGVTIQYQMPTPPTVDLSAPNQPVNEIVAKPKLPKTTTPASATPAVMPEE